MRINSMPITAEKVALALMKEQTNKGEEHVMAVDLEKILRPVDHPMKPFPAKYMTLASGDTMVIRQVDRDEIPEMLRIVAPLMVVERDYYDLVAARVYAELLGWYHHRMQDEYVLVAQIDGELAAVVNGRQVTPKLGMSLHTMALRRGLRIGAHAFAAKMEYHIDILGHDEVLVVAESPIGFRRWMIEYQLEKRFDTAHELGGVPSWALTSELFDRARSTLVVGRRPVPRRCWPRPKPRSCLRRIRRRPRPTCWPPPGSMYDPTASALISQRSWAGRPTMRDVYVAGIGITTFTRLEYPLAEIAAYPSMIALKDSGITDVDHVYVANMGSARVNHQTALASAVVDTLSLTPAGAAVSRTDRPRAHLPSRTDSWRWPPACTTSCWWPERNGCGRSTTSRRPTSSPPSPTRWPSTSTA